MLHAEVGFGNLHSCDQSIDGHYDDDVFPR